MKTCYQLIASGEKCMLSHVSEVKHFSQGKKLQGGRTFSTLSKQHKRVAILLEPSFHVENGSDDYFAGDSC